MKSYEVKMRHSIHPAVYLVLEQANQILLMHRSNTGYMDGLWGLPSGHVESEEPLTRALCREVEEEIGIILFPCDLQLIHVSQRRYTDNKTNNTVEYIDFYFTPRHWNGNPECKEPDKCDAIEWFDQDNLPSLVPYISEVLQAIRGQVLLSEIGWEKAMMEDQ